MKIIACIVDKTNNASIFVMFKIFVEKLNTNNKFISAIHHFTLWLSFSVLWREKT